MVSKRDAIRQKRTLAACAAVAWMGLVGAVQAAPVDEVFVSLHAHPEDRELLQKLRLSITDMGDETQQTACMAVYSLGCLHVGMTEQGRKTRAFLLTRLGKDPVVARLSPDRLDVVCSACGGASKGSACAECGGTGRALSPAAVEKEYLALLDELSGQPPAAEAVPASVAPASAPEWGSMQEFVRKIQAFREQAREGHAEVAEIEAVMAKPDDYRGRTIQCRGYVIGYHPKQITVSPDSDLSSRRRLDLTPDSLYVGTKVGTEFRATGQPVPAALVFALINKSQNVAFTVDPIEELKK